MLEHRKVQGLWKIGLGVDNEVRQRANKGVPGLAATYPAMASLVAQMVKCLPAMQETWVQFLGWEDPLEKEMANHSSTLAGRFHGRRSLVATVHGVAESHTQQSNFTFIFYFMLLWKNLVF